MKNLLALPLCLLGFAPPQDARDAVQKLQSKIERLCGDELKAQTDPAALAASLGHDPQRLFDFVRKLPYHAYRGALRGSGGTLLAGAANDVDRCLLLKDLLERAPTKPAVRFAFGELSEEAAAKLVARALEAPPGLPGYSSPKLDELLARAEATPESYATATQTLRTSANPRLGALSKSVRADRETLEAALKEAGVRLTGSEADGAAAKARSIRSHVWLQVEREGKWVDLDPSFEDGKPAVAAARTADALPEDQHHAVAVRLLVERKNDAALESEPIYAGRRRTADLAGRAINLTLMPAGFDAEKSPGPLEKQIAKFSRFQAVVDLGGAVENARVFDLQGKVHQSKDGKFGEDTGSVVGGRVGGALGRKPAVTHLAAVRLELEVQVPGEPAHVETRYLLDRLSPAARAAGKSDWQDPKAVEDKRFCIGLFQSWSVWTAAGPVNDAYQIERLVRVLARDGGIPKLIFDAAEGKQPVKLSKVAEKIEPLPMELVGLWQSSLRLAQGAFKKGEGSCYPDRPSLLVWKEGLTTGAKGEPMWRGGVDLAYVPLGCTAKTPLDAARARFMYGLLLTEGESALVEKPGATVYSTAAVFRKAREEKIAIVALSGRTDLPLPAQVHAELKAGRVVVAPKEPVTIGPRKATAWWRLDPATGALLGIGDTGEGQAVSEGVLVLENISIPMVQRCLKFVVCFNVGIGAGRSMQDAGRECMTEFMRDFVKETIEGAVDHFLIDPLKTKAKNKALDQVGEAFDDPQMAQFYDMARDAYGDVMDQLDGLKGQVALLLAMGKDIAEYANQKNKDFRNR